MTILGRPCISLEVHEYPWTLIEKWMLVDSSQTHIPDLFCARLYDCRSFHAGMEISWNFKLLELTLRFFGCSHWLSHHDFVFSLISANQQNKYWHVTLYCGVFQVFQHRKPGHPRIWENGEVWRSSMIEIGLIESDFTSENLPTRSFVPRIFSDVNANIF